METILSSEADKMISILYKEYLVKRSQGAPKEKAKSSGGSKAIHEQLLPNWSFEDVDDTCRELSRAGLISCLWADDSAYTTKLTDAGVTYLKGRFRGGLKDVVDFISKAFPLLP